MKNNKLPKILVFLLVAVAMLSLHGTTASAEDVMLPCVAHVATCRTAATDMLPCSPAVSVGRRLIPGGMPFGVKFSTDGVLVVGFCDVDTASGKVNPAHDAGLRTGDVIRRLEDTPVDDAAVLGDAMEQQGGRPFRITFERDGQEQTVTLTPAYSLSDGKYKSGIWIRDGGAGIGTVTFIEPDSGLFAGLGHGICDGDTGELIPMQRGTVIDVTISGIVRGLPGTPGEVKGYFNQRKLGSVFGNTECGVYGLFSALPAACGEAIPIGTRSELHEGEAELLCSLGDSTVQRYRVSLSAINPAATSNKCFTVTVTDPALLERTGGIVQGMSGSPIIQDGKLVGAVTHVLINDPTRGYGIFIENMLNAANMPMAKAS